MEPLTSPQLLGPSCLEECHKALEETTLPVKSRGENPI